MSTYVSSTTPFVIRSPPCVQLASTEAVRGLSGKGAGAGGGGGGGARQVHHRGRGAGAVGHRAQSQDRIKVVSYIRTKIRMNCLLPTSFFSSKQVVRLESQNNLAPKDESAHRDRFVHFLLERYYQEQIDRRREPEDEGLRRRQEQQRIILDAFQGRKVWAFCLSLSWAQMSSTTTYEHQMET